MMRRAAVRSEFTQRFRKSGKREIFGIGDDWRFDYPPDDVHRGWQMWKSSGYAVFPSYEDAIKHDPKWISDIMLAQEIYDWVNNDSTAMQIANRQNGNENVNSPDG